MLDMTRFPDTCLHITCTLYNIETKIKLSPCVSDVARMTLTEAKGLVYAYWRYSIYMTKHRINYMILATTISLYSYIHFTEYHYCLLKYLDMFIWWKLNMQMPSMGWFLQSAFVRLSYLNWFWNCICYNKLLR